MNLLNQLFEIPSLLGIVFLLAGIILYQFPPKKINYLYGYRTPSAMKNEAVWTFSQKYASIKMIQSGCFMIIIGLACIWLELQDNLKLIIGLSLLLLTVIFIFYSTEKSIKTKFPNI